ncbi:MULTISPECIES: DUF2298 domain-containing protein [Saliphagus]|uniref:DUF2298 domain-containing protein n=1 Tax=Saliphagus infecundisoli TaxID=1849069 RepID=A0ABD5Q9N6_9EURY|nr:MULTISPECIES: DUF2298 domain-containing protein [Saliphagus]
MVVGTEVALAVRWLVAVLGLGALALPLAAAVFRDGEGRGAGLAIPLALAAVGLGGFWVGRLSFGRLSVAVALLALCCGSALALRRGVEIDSRRYAEVAAVFAAAFAFLLAVRAVDPGIVPWGGEKYLDYGLLTRLSKAGTLPPEDPWFAGEPVRYYYGGHLLAASLARLTATPPHYAYTLALAGIYATLVSAAYGLAGAIAASRGVARLPAALLGAVLVGFASNLATPVRTLAWLLPGGRAVLEAVGVPMERAGGETVAAGPDAFGYWDASRLIPGTINEFPLFAFLNGDLHAHMLATPFLLLAVGICLAYWETPAAERRRRRLLAFLALPPVAGWLAVVNAWDLPTALGLAWLTLALAPAPPRTLLPERLARPYRNRLENAPDGAAELGRPLLAAVLVAVVGAGALVAVAPFLPTLSGGAERSLALVADRSPLPAFLLVHGAFLAVAYRYLAARVPVPAGARTAGLAAVLVAAAWAAGLLPVLVVAPLLVLGWLAARRGGFESLLFVAGAGIVATVELVYLADPAGPGRLNTVFKSYVHVWLLWALAAGIALAWLLERTGSTGGVDEKPRADARRTYDGLAAIGIVLLVCSLSIYGGLALLAHAENADGLGLDARAELQETEPDVAAAVGWLADREPGARIVEAPTPPEYTYGTASDGEPPPSRAVSGASTFSGLPTLAGWTHAADYHGEDAYRERVADAETVFEGSDAERATVLENYGIDYVYVGPNERAWYDLTVEDDDSLSVAAEFGAVRIYEVEGS